MCVQIHAQVSETSSARYLCLSLKAITSLPLLAKTTGAGRVPPSSLTNLSAWRPSREGEREGERGENSSEVSSLRRVVILRVCQKRYTSQTSQLKNTEETLTSWMASNIHSARLSSWFNPHNSSLIGIKSKFPIKMF